MIRSSARLVLRVMNRTSNNRPSIEALPRELDSRSSDGIEVRLLWHPQDSRVSVSVNDTKTGESFELQVRHGDRALDVFHHPYAYSALAALAPFEVEASTAGSDC